MKTLETFIQSRATSQPLNLLCGCLALQLWPRNWSAHTRVTRISVCSAVALHKITNGSSDRESGIDVDSIAEIANELIKRSKPDVLSDDFLAEVEWGAASILYEGNEYRIFYGAPYEFPVDYWNELIMLASRSENESVQFKLKSSLSFQDWIIRQIPEDYISLRRDDIRPGSIEIPTKSFIKATANLLKNIEKAHLLDDEPFSNITLDPDTPLPIDGSSLGTDEMFDFATRNIFIKFDGCRFPLFPIHTIAAAGAEVARVALSGIESNTIQRKRLVADLGTRLFKLNVAFECVSNAQVYCAGEHLELDIALIIGDHIVWIDLFHPEDPLTEHDFFSKRQGKIDILRSLTGKIVIEGWSSLEREFISQESPTALSLFEQTFITACFHCLQVSFIPIDEHYDGIVSSVPDLLAWTSSVDDPEKTSRFLKFYKKESHRLGPGPSIADHYFLFSEYGEGIEDGAREYDMVMGDPHWATNSRFQELAKQWDLIRRAGTAVDADVWVFKEAGEGVIQSITKRGDRLVTFIGYHGKSRFRILIEKSTFAGDAKILHFVCSLLEDTLKWFLDTRFESLIRDEPIEVELVHNQTSNDELGISVLPAEKPQHRFKLEIDEEMLIKSFSQPNTRAAEWEIVEMIARSLGADQELVKEEVNRQRSAIAGRPRFRFGIIEKQVAFPEGVKRIKSEDRHYKEARRRIATIALDHDIPPGRYQGSEAKRAITLLASSYEKSLVKELERFSWYDVLRFSIAQSGAAMFENWLTKNQIRQSINDEVDYDRISRLSGAQSDFIKFSKNVRFIIELICAWRNTGNAMFDRETFSLLIAMADWQHVLQGASDVLHYQIERATLSISDDYVPEIEYPDDFKKALERYQEFEAGERLRLLNEELPDIREGVAEHIDGVNKVAAKELGFSFQTLILILDALSRWGFADKRSEQPFYAADLEDVVLEIAQFYEASKAEVRSAIQWLELSQKGLHKVVGQNRAAERIPMWEIRKRPFRYTIRPLISTGNELVWEPMACAEARDIWIGNLTDGAAPHELENSRVESAIGKLKRAVEKNMEVATYEMLARKTRYVEKNIDLAKRFKNCGYPKNLGDYDVLAYLPDEKVLLYVECKHLLSPHCLKDSKRERRKLFGPEGREEKGYFFLAERRGLYLRQYVPKIMTNLGWILDDPEQIRVRNVMLVERLSLWHFYRPRKYDIESHTFSSFMAEFSLKAN